MAQVASGLKNSERTSSMPNIMRKNSMAGIAFSVAEKHKKGGQKDGDDNTSEADSPTKMKMGSLAMSMVKAKQITRRSSTGSPPTKSAFKQNYLESLLQIQSFDENKEEEKEENKGNNTQSMTDIATASVAVNRLRENKHDSKNLQSPKGAGRIRKLARQSSQRSSRYLLGDQSAKIEKRKNSMQADARFAMMLASVSLETEETDSDESRKIKIASIKTRWAKVRAVVHMGKWSQQPSDQSAVAPARLPSINVRRSLRNRSSRRRVSLDRPGLSGLPQVKGPIVSEIES